MPLAAPPSAEYRYPLYRRPADLESWPLPHPTRLELEGADGLQGSQGPLRGLELVWLRDRLEAFLVQVQGSARLALPDGQSLSVSYAGRTEYPYRSIGRALIEAGVLPAEGLTLPAVLAYFRQHPAALDTYLPQNQRFIFFRESDGGPPHRHPQRARHRRPLNCHRQNPNAPRAPALIALPLPNPSSGPARPIHRLVLDQDTGGAILGPGRVDLFIGTGPAAGELAGLINTPGQLYYLLLRSP